MRIDYYSDGYKLYARIYLGRNEKDYQHYTCGWLDDGTAESGIEALHEILILKLI